MKKIRAAVVGYGNIGKFSVEALEAAPDFEIAGVVRRQGDKDKPAELAQVIPSQSKPARRASHEIDLSSRPFQTPDLDLFK